ncbi:endolytic transglycosylase MltG [Thiomonas intermedia]|uniref:endolytic transglycosylase MltG n=1 Tax=Thiomonas intermedia TaxID=926 RepID=UPI0015D091E7
MALLMLIGAGVWWANQPIALRETPLDFSVRPGSSALSAARQIRAQGADLQPRLFYWLARVTGRGAELKAGSYEISAGMTPWALLERMARGDQTLLALTIPEGWTFEQMLQAMAATPGLQHDVGNLTPQQIMQRIGAPEQIPPEGAFFPDTYLYARGSSEIDVLRRAYQAMRKRLAVAWARRAPDLPLQTPEQALVLASLIEKETGRPQDREKIAAVFVNRLRVGMPLQSDPTVIYGMGPRFHGNLTKRDLQTPSPYNTYIISGLPPTPIALPGEAALQAALHPAPIKALYFVARGNGTSQFSDTLAEHNAAVARYILKTQ